MLNSILLVVDPVTWTWSDTWMVTGLGFFLVLVLLFCFVYIMKLLGWIMQPHKKAAPAPAVATPSAQTEQKGEEDMKLNANTTAAIAMALNLYFYGIHDEEPTQVTLRPHHTAWNSKMYGMNNLHR